MILNLQQTLADRFQKDKWKAAINGFWSYKYNYFLQFFVQKIYFPITYSQTAKKLFICK